MKKALLFITLVVIFASCSNDNKNSEQQTAKAVVATEDTIGLSDFKEWKEKRESLATQQTFTSNGVVEAPAVTEERPAPVIIYRDVPAKTHRVARTSKPATRPVYQEPKTETNEIAKAPTPPAEGTKREAYGRGAGTETSSDGEGSIASGDETVVAPAEVPAKKEGWSKAAKGTAIGGTSGAVIGAVISKNKTKGAVIGGIVGAAGGYIFGRKQDKKDGRY